MVEVKTGTPTVDEYNAMRRSAGWPTYDADAVAEGLAHSLSTVCLRDDGAIVAMGRVVGDGAITFYIQDVMVLPDKRGLGYARIVMEALMGYIKSVAAPNSVVGLMSANGVEGLYKKFGFVRRPVIDSMGAGMVWSEI